MVQSRKELKLISSTESAGTMELDPTTRYLRLALAASDNATYLSGVRAEGNEKYRLPRVVLDTMELGPSTSGRRRAWRRCQASRQQGYYGVRSPS